MAQALKVSAARYFVKFITKIQVLAKVTCEAVLYLEAFYLIAKK